MALLASGVAEGALGRPALRDADHELAQLFRELGRPHGTRRAARREREREAVGVRHAGDPVRGNQLTARQNACEARGGQGGEERPVEPRAEVSQVERVLDGLDVPLHPGAERYYREVGLIN